MLSINCSSYRFKVYTAIAIATSNLTCGQTNVQAQIVSDQTTNTQVEAINNTSLITGGIQKGQNLFHSFEQFSLAPDAIANFNQALDIQNIFSRVTGGTVSNIDGLIQTQGSANLFLLNPAGIIFGANAQLNVGGSFIATTGDRFIFEDGVEFGSTTTANEPLLSITSPVGLQYGDSPGNITVLPTDNRVFSNSGGLNIKPGNTLGLLGGNVSLSRNSLNGSVGSKIEIGSIKSGKIELESDRHRWQFSYPNTNEFGKINLNNRALINSSGVVNLYGNTINLAAGSGIRNFSDPNGVGSITKLEATESINLDGGLLLTQVGQLLALESENTSVGGDIFLTAPDIFITNGSLVSAGTLGQGSGGNIMIDASKTIKLYSDPQQNPPIITTSTQGAGNGGEIQINTAQLFVQDGSQIQALAGEGAGGTITVNARESIDISGIGILRSQDNTGNLTETELISGLSASSGIEGLPPAQQPPGESGSLILNTTKLSIEEEAEISVSNFGLADGGDIEITASNLNLNQSGKIIANTASGEGGSISIRADESVILDNDSSISTTAQQNGNGGNITVKTDNLLLSKSDEISANASLGNGGKITIDAQGLFADPDSSITANSEIEKKKGIVEIVTLDLNARLQMQHKEESPLVAENYIRTGCGVGENFAQNQFRNIGRGGVPSNLMQETTAIETISDLEIFTGEYRSPFHGGVSVTNHKSKPAKPEQVNISKDHTLHSQQINEANTWIVNAQGKIELLASEETYLATQPSICKVN